MNKIRHHPYLSNTIVWFIWAGISIGLGSAVNLWLVLLFLPGLALYVFGFWWGDREELICPECGFEPWTKSVYYCSRDGTRLVFRRKVKVKKGSMVRKDRIPELVCSKGHIVNTYDKFCPKCGETL